MTVSQTKAAIKLQESGEELSSHQVISLLMDGALERVDQARDCLRSGDNSDADLLVRKLVGIINGLRGSLDMDAGGEIAINLDALYRYMVERLGEDSSKAASLEEVQRLIAELKGGWDAIDSELPVAS